MKISPHLNRPLQNNESLSPIYNPSKTPLEPSQHTLPQYNNGYQLLCAKEKTDEKRKVNVQITSLIFLFSPYQNNFKMKDDVPSQIVKHP